MPLFLQLHLFRLFRVLIADLYVMSQVIEERMKLRAMRIKATCKGGPKWPNIGKICGPSWSNKGAQNTAERERTDQSGQTPPRPAVGGAQLCAFPRTAVRPSAARVSFVFARLFVFQWFLPLKLQCIWPYLAPNSTPIPYHSPISIRVRVVLERERGRSEEYKDSGPGLWIERLKREFWMSNSFPSLVFSHFTFMLCNFWFGYCSLILVLLQILV